MKRITSILLLFLATALSATAQKVSLKWELSNKDNLSASSITGDDNSILSATFSKWSGIDSVATMKSGNAESGYTAPTYTPNFTQFFVTTKNTSRTKGQSITFTVKTPSGHTFKPTRISFDAAKCGTDGGNFDVCTKLGSNAELPFATTQVPLRNRTGASNPNGYSHHEYTLSDVLADGCDFQVTLYIYNINGTDNANPKAIAFRNVVIDGVVDEPIYTAEHYVTDATFTTKAGETKSMMQLVKGLKNGQQASYPELLFGDPSNFKLTTATGYTYKATYANKTATFDIQNSDGETEFTFSVLFRVTNREPKPKATALKRGLMAINLSQSGGSGNLVSWRYRKDDNNQVRFKLYRGTNATTQATKLNGGNYNESYSDIKETYAKGTVIKIHDKPTRNGYKFLYWKGSEYQPGDSYTVIEDHTFVAQWESEKTPSTPSTPTTPVVPGTPVAHNDPNTPITAQTGDTRHVTLWFALMAMSLIGITAAAFGKRRRTNK